ncbi:MAG TPA: AAA family ATPase [Rhodoglobus sp.]|nr:AAA family ATPase [Rhodoglobus sp.]
MIRTLAIEGYRSLRSFVVELDRLTVVTGPNGSGKSSVYRALRLIAASARDGAVAALAREGGLSSVRWAGPETISPWMRSGAVPVQGTVRSQPVALKLGFGGDDLGYAVDLGLPVPSASMFTGDPEIKAEAVFAGPLLRPATSLTERHGPSVKVRDANGTWQPHEHRIRPWQSMLSEFADPALTPELFGVRESMRSWRFYDHFRTDAAAPARQAHPGTRTPVLADDGRDLASALQTIREEGLDQLDRAVRDAFPGSRVLVEDRDGRFTVALQQPGMLRPLGAEELSDGTLRFLLLAAALLTPRPPALLVLNEPETSLHPDLLPPLAGLIAAAAERTQVVVVSHAAALIDALADARRIELEKDTGETVVRGQGRLEGPNWAWPKR